MAFESNFITFIGNLTDDPDLRFTQGGAPVASFRVASNRGTRTVPATSRRRRRSSTSTAGVIWRRTRRSRCPKGDRVIVIGRVRVRSYENREGQTVWTTEIEADEIAPSLRWARASVQRSSGPSAAAATGGSASPPPPSDDDVPF
jgi:single-strand DNA-binding protein